MGVLNTTPRTWVAAEIVTAAELNAEVRDAFTTIQSAWTAYVPTLTNIAIGNGTLNAYYQRIGKTINVRVRFAAGSSTTYSAGALGISAPVTPHADYTTTFAGTDWAVGSGIIQPTTRQGATVVFNTTAGGVFNFFVDNLAASNVVTNTIPGAFGTSSVLTLTATYEAA